jgi:hypothetical protein
LKQQEQIRRGTEDAGSLGEYVRELVGHNLETSEAG